MRQWACLRHCDVAWQGRTSSQDEKGTAALLAKTMDDELGGAATQARAGKEGAGGGGNVERTHPG